MKSEFRIICVFIIGLMLAGVLGGCKAYPIEVKQSSSGQQTVEEGKASEVENEKSEDFEKKELGKKTQKTSDKDVDVIFFMGESNMSGFGGDASLAPHLYENAGEEFRAVSDPTKLYPIKEPFGLNESNPSGVDDFAGAKKGSLVSAFINEYNRKTERRVVAVSASMGSSDMDKWTSEGVMADVKERFDTTLSYLKDKEYEVGHIYVVWLQGESDGLKGSAESTYKNALEDFMKPLFKAGLEKVFIIVPGRTIDYSDVYQNVINAQIDMCVEDDNYALATTVLTKVSTECMTDQYQYNQHALNYVGTEAAKSVAYYTQNGVKKIVYDYKEGKWIVPRGIKENSQEKEELVYPSEIDINQLY